ncbi:hypothetical protein [Xanthocytophaga agilis]|uniref:Uncharacterized protein n=1 Tax=Xanthocytophaga agilis TaxID=3048010 RepID=A0AAE3R8Y8_9BACT|nr:hypothetical protein [Xanthocytophaga agilis]MDJ1503649.1 hypothetical protein [Xanthocytophaga agilis]
MNSLDNSWWYKKHKEYISVSYFERKLLIEHIKHQSNLKKNRYTDSKLVFNWNLAQEKYAFFFDYQGGDDEIATWLLNSRFVESKSVLMDIDHKLVIEVETMYYIRNWYDFYAATAFMGQLLCNETFNLVMELKEDDGILFSNFEIKTSSACI